MVNRVGRLGRVFAGAAIVSIVLVGCGKGSGGGDDFVAIDAAQVVFSQIIPDRGPSAGGNVVTVIGSGFVAGQTAVTINGVALGTLNVVTSGRLTGVMPALAAAGAPAATIQITVGTASDTEVGIYGYILPLRDATPESGLTVNGGFLTFGGGTLDVSSVTRGGGAAPVPLAGTAVAVGDFDQSGTPDIAIGSPHANGGIGDVHVFFSDGTGQFPTNAQVVITGSTVANSFFGFSLAAGDVSGDTIDDLVIGAPGNTGNTGQVFLATSDGGAQTFNGGANVATSIFTAVAAGGLEGFSVAVGSFDGGGEDANIEIAIGGPDFNAGTGDEGRVVIIDSPNFNPVTPETATGAAGDARGTALDTGDLDGATDALDDLLIGDVGPVTALHNGTLTNFRSDGTNAAGFFTLGGVLVAPTNLETNSEFAAALGVGDIDGDTNEDIFVGHPLQDNTGLADSGLVELLFSSGVLGVSSRQSIPDPVPEAGAEFGLALAVGDIDGNGRSDVVIAGPRSTANGQVQGGQIHIFLTNVALSVVSFSETLIEDPANVTAEVNARFGIALETGDFNVDGRADIVVTTQGDDPGGTTDSGEAFVFYQPR